MPNLYSIYSPIPFARYNYSCFNVQASRLEQAPTSSPIVFAEKKLYKTNTEVCPLSETAKYKAILIALLLHPRTTKERLTIMEHSPRTYIFRTESYPYREVSFPSPPC